VSIAEFLEVQGATLPPSVLAPMMVQIADAVAFVHDHGIVHRCVSNKTVYVDAGYTCKLAHFVSAEQESTSGGSRPEGLQIRWTAPEALSHGVFSKAADVWSLAVLSYVVISNQGSIWAHVEDAALVNLLNEGIRLPQPVGMPNSLYDFLMMCWADNAGARPPASAFARGLAFDGDLNRRSIVDHISQSVVGTYKLMQPDGVVAQDEDDPTYAYPAEPDFAPEDVIASFTSATDALAASSSDEEEADDVVGTVPPLPVYHLGNSAEDPLYHDQQVTLGAISEAASPAITPGYGQKQSFDSITRRQPSEASSYHGHVRGSIISDNDVPTSPGGTRPTTVWHPSHAAAAASSPSLHAHAAPLPPSNPFAALSQGELVRDDRAPVGRPRANSKLEMLRARELNQLDFSEDL
jgi:serine/threonine protein kinase